VGARVGAEYGSGHRVPLVLGAGDRSRVDRSAAVAVAC
jgi:hypothetical protein